MPISLAKEIEAKQSMTTPSWVTTFLCVALAAISFRAEGSPCAVRVINSEADSGLAQNAEIELQAELRRSQATVVTRNPQVNVRLISVLPAMHSTAGDRSSNVRVYYVLTDAQDRFQAAAVCVADNAACASTMDKAVRRYCPAR